jgi:hypothetical protein
VRWSTAPAPAVRTRGALFDCGERESMLTVRRRLGGWQKLADPAIALRDFLLYEGGREDPLRWRLSRELALNSWKRLLMSTQIYFLTSFFRLVYTASTNMSVVHGPEVAP